MDNNKFRRFYVDWWEIKRSTIYGIAAGLILLILIGAGGWWLYRSDFLAAKPEANDAPKDSARIISFEGDVRVIRAATRETILVTKLTFVAAGDTVQTQNDGRAQIQMIDGSKIDVRPNSTIVIRDSTSIFGGTNVRVTLDDGQINVKTQDQTEATQNVVEVLESENRLFPQTDASFNINEQTNGGEIRISRGGVESNVGGERVIIQENEFAGVNNGKISPKERLLIAPKPVAPVNGDQIPMPGDVSFRWQKPEANSSLSYDVQISQSPFFVAGSVLVERAGLTSQIFNLANLAPGTYYWRLRATAASGQMSNWGDPWRFVVVKQTTSENLTASDWQVEPVGGSIYIVKGKTLPGMIVRVAGREVFAAADGSFRIQITSSSPSISVEISDDRGNRSRYALNLNSANAVKQN